MSKENKFIQAYGRFLPTLFLGISLLLTLVLTQPDLNDNSKSRFATIESLVEYGTFQIDQSRFVDTHDKIFVNGSFYSDKTPLLSMYGAGVYAVVSRITGVDFENSPDTSVRVITLLTSGVSFAVLVLYFLAALQLGGFSKSARVAGSFAMGFGFIGSGYATTLNHHIPAAAALMVAFYYLMRILRETHSEPRFYWIAAGAAAGLAPAIDLPATIAAVAIFGLLMRVNPHRTMLIFVPVGLIPVAFHFLFTWVATKDFLPAQLHPEWFNYPGSYWNSPEGIHAIESPLWGYILNVTIGFRGIFSLTPIFIFAILGTFRPTKSSGLKLGERKLILRTLILSFLLFILVAPNLYGGDGIGFRFMIFVMPWLFLAFADFMNFKQLQITRFTVAIAMIWSIFNAIDSWRGPWRVGELERTFRTIGAVPEAIREDY